MTSKKTQGPRFKDIPQFPTAHYEVDVPWASLEDHLTRWDERGGFGGLDLQPDYQREHVWSREQQVAFVEYQLRGGEVGRNLLFNSPDWGSTWRRPIELVDGMQRLESVRAFLRDDLPAFGHCFSEYVDRMGFSPSFRFRVCKLEKRSEILALYLNVNGGTPHHLDELERVRGLLAQEIEREAQTRGTP